LETDEFYYAQISNLETGPMISALCDKISVTLWLDVVIIVILHCELLNCYILNISKKKTPSLLNISKKKTPSLLKGVFFLLNLILY